MNVQVFGLKNCDTCRKVRKWLDANGIAHEFIDVREHTPPLAALKQWHTTLGDTLLNRRGTTWRQLSDAEKAKADRNLPALLHAYPALMKRPVMINENGIHAGFDEKAWQGLLKKQARNCF